MNSATYRKISAVAVFAVPVAPAVFLALRLFSQGRTEAEQLFGAGDSLSLVLLLLALAAAVTAVGLEFVGIISGHVTAKLYQRKDRRWLLTAAALITYTALGYTALMGTVGAFAFLIAPLIYFVTAISTAADEEHQEVAERQQAQAAEERARRQQQEQFERQMRQEQLQFEQRLAMSQQEHEYQLRATEAEQKSRERIAKAEIKAATPAPSRAKAGNIPAKEPESRNEAALVCPGCGYEATSSQALKGHQRWCKPYESWKLRGEVEHSLNGRQN